MLSRITPATPTVCPVSVDLIRQHAYVDQYYNDNLIMMYSIAATELAENMTNRFFLQRSVQWVISADEKLPIYYGTSANSQNYFLNLYQVWLHCPHSAVSIDSVAIGDWNSDGVDTPLVLDTDYQVDVATDPARIMMLNFDQFDWQHDHVTINYTSGYAATAADVPVPIQIAIMLLTTRMIEAKGDQEAALWSSGAESLLAPYVVNRFGGSSDMFSG